MTPHMQSLSARPAWKALEAHYQKIRELHLRNLFADDLTRGERMTAEAVGIYLDYSKNRITEETLGLLLQLAEESRPACADRRHVSRREDQHRRRSGPSCTWPCAPRKVQRSSSMARTWFLTSMPCSIRWPASPTTCGAATGRASPESASRMSSILASAARTWGQSWPTRRSGTTANAR